MKQKIVYKFKDKLISGIGDGKILFEGVEKAFNYSLIRFGLQLEKILERFDLNVKKIGIIR
jgi:hypothetical protein